MAKEVVAKFKLELAAGKATPAPPVGTVLGSQGINIPEFVKMFNAQTQDKIGYRIPVEISIYTDRSFTFILKSPPASDLLKKAAKIESGSANSKKTVAGTITRAQLLEIANAKKADLNANDDEAAMKIIAGSARSMGIKIQD